MQHLYTCLLICLFTSISLTAQQVVMAPGTYSDVVYVPARDRLYAVTPEGGTPGNALCLIDQATGDILESYAVGLNPTQVVATTSGNYLYIAFAEESRIRRFNLLTNSIDLDFSLGGDETFEGPYYAEDMLPIRGSDDLLAVARRRYYTYPRGAGVVLFDAGIQQVYADTINPASNGLIYTDLDSIILGYENEVYYGLQSFAVTSFSLSPLEYYGSLFTSPVAPEYTDGYLYGSDGTITAVNEGVPSYGEGTGLEDLYTYGGVAVEAVPATNRIYYLGIGWQYNRLALSAYDLTTRSLVRTIDLVPTSGGLDGQGGKELVGLGSPETMAFISTYNQLGIITLCASAESDPPPAYAGSTYFCPGDSLLLALPEDFLGEGETVLWSDGRMADSIFVTAPGEYTYRIVDAGGCPGPTSELFYVEEIYYGLEGPYIDEPLTRVLCVGSSVELRATFYYGSTVIWNTGDTTPVLTVTEPGTYVAYGINDDYGCRSYPSEPVVITGLATPAPAAPLVEQGLYIDTCASNVIDLTVAREDLFYYWSTDYAGYYQENYGSNAISVFPSYDSGVTTFTVQAQDANGCLSPVTTGRIISRPIPDVPTIQYNEATTTLASDLPGPLYWYHEDVLEGESTGRFYRPQRNGFYTARKKGAYCPSEPSNLVSVGGVSTSVYDTELSEQVRVFPNPTRETVNVSVGSGLVWKLAPGNMAYRLINSAGALITTGQLDPQVPQTPISVAGLPAGVYTLTLATQEGTMLRKRITVM